MPPRRSIGLAVDTVGSYGREVIYGVMEFCHRNPHWTIAVEPRMWVYENEPRPDKWNVDGIIIQAHSPEVIRRVRACGRPAVNVANMVRGVPPLPTVLPDDAAIGRMGAEYLLSLDFRRFGICSHNVADYSVRRGAAFKKRLAEAGAAWSECDASESSDLDPWLIPLAKPAAVFCCNDAWAHRLLSAARRCDVRVPEQVAVLGVDDDELLNAVSSPSLSSIAIPAAKVGFEAARMLEGALNGIPAPMLTLLAPLSVVPRASTDVCNIEDPDVARALQFLKENMARPLQVDDVLEHLSISRRTLERRFRAALGRSIAAEIRRARVERAKQLLLHTTLSIEEVAAASGFSNVSILGVVFRETVGETPTAFRRRGAVASPKRAADAPS